MLKSIKIPSEISLDIINSMITEMSDSEFVDLTLPINLKYTGFGILPEYWQFIFSWMRNKKGKLIIPINLNELDKIEKFTSNYNSFVILSSIWNNKEIVNHKGESLRAKFKEHMAFMHKSINSFSENITNVGITIPCFDHLPNDKGLTHWFYNTEYDFAGHPSNIENSIYLMLKSISRIYYNRTKDIISDSFDDIVRIIWELMKNTDEHAKKDHNRLITLNPNTRGLFVEIHRNTKTKLVAETKHIGLKKFYKDSLVGSNVFFLEISVFDSGSGIVKNFLNTKWKNNMDVEDDINIIKKCLIKGQSSINNQFMNKGYGLDEVLRLLNNYRGFLKIRTGKTSVYRSLIESPYVKSKKINEIELFDWKLLKKDCFTSLESVEGTIITMAIPLNIK